MRFTTLALAFCAPLWASADSPELVWSDEFNEFNKDNWTIQTGGGGWGNNELQYYTDGANVQIEYDEQIESKVLVIEAREENTEAYDCWYGSCRYTSTRIKSLHKQEFTYGRMEARIKLASTPGVWPAFWMLGNDIETRGWPGSGEIDIIEHVGFEPQTTHGALHGPGYSGDTPFVGDREFEQRVDASYHVYAVEWAVDEIRWFVDGVEFYRVTRVDVEEHGDWVFDHPFFFLFNLAVGGNWPGEPDESSQFPQTMAIDYVRVYQ